ncbi:hypothetical protein BH11PAT4_BH11PAT4_0200 [soil metagenome]
MHSIFSQAQTFLETVFSNLPTEISANEIPVIDHLCYRVTSVARYEELKDELSQTETLEDESEVNGRPICIVRLQNPLTYREYVIDALELPAPSAKPYPEGFEHLEFVIPSLSEFMVRHPDLTLDTKGLTRETNKDLSLKLSTTLAVKFHEAHIFEVLVEQRSLR